MVEDKSIADRIRESQGPKLGLSMQDIMLELIGLAERKAYDGLRELRTAYIDFESRNPRRTEVARLADGNLYYLCSVADNLLHMTETESHLPYSTRLRMASLEATKRKPNVESPIKLFYREATGYKASN